MTNAYLGDHTAIALTQFGQKIYVDTRDVSIAPHLLLDGMWEHWITKAMIPYLNQSIFFDVGANFGWYSLLASYAGAKQIISIEPNDKLFSLLLRSLKVNGVYGGKNLSSPMAVGDTGNVVTLGYTRENLGGCSVLKRQSEANDTYWVNVQTMSLDSIERIYHYQFEEGLFVFKIDVEGYEPRVVLGGKQLFKERNCTAFIEYHADPKGENKLVEMLDFLEQNRYQMTHVRTDSEFHSITREGLSALPDAEMLCFRRFSA